VKTIRPLTFRGDDLTDSDNGSLVARVFAICYTSTTTGKVHMNEEIKSDPQGAAPTMTFHVSGIMPVQDGIALVMLADGSVRWTKMEDENTEDGA
jgi:hypothetical protein